MRNRPMKKSYVPKNDFSSREKEPIMAKDKKGNVTLLCPFCQPAHPINQQTASICGTIIQVRAIQQIYKPHSENPTAVCIKCGSGKGEMVLFQGALVHIHDCKPGTVTLSVPPKFSSLAKWTHSMKDGYVKRFIQSVYGTAFPVEEVMPDGKKTGNIPGYFFQKIRGTNGNRTTGKGEPTPAIPAEPIS